MRNFSKIVLVFLISALLGTSCLAKNKEKSITYLEQMETLIKENGRLKKKIERQRELIAKIGSQLRTAKNEAKRYKKMCNDYGLIKKKKRTVIQHGQAGHRERKNMAKRIFTNYFLSYRESFNTTDNGRIVWIPALAGQDKQLECFDTNCVGRIDGTIIQIAGKGILLVDYKNQTVALSNVKTEGLYDRQPYAAMVTMTGTYQYNTVMGAGSTVPMAEIIPTGITAQQFLAYLSTTPVLPKPFKKWEMYQDYFNEDDLLSVLEKLVEDSTKK